MDNESAEFKKKLFLKISVCITFNTVPYTKFVIDLVSIVSETGIKRKSNT